VHTGSGGSDAAVVQVPPRSLARKTAGGTPYSKPWREPSRRKQSRQVRTTPLSGSWKPQSGKVGHSGEPPEMRLEMATAESRPAVPASFFRVKWTTLLPPT